MVEFSASGNFDFSERSVLQDQISGFESENKRLWQENQGLEQNIVMLNVELDLARENNNASVLTQSFTNDHDSNFDSKFMNPAQLDKIMTLEIEKSEIFRNDTSDLTPTRNRHQISTTTDRSSVTRTNLKGNAWVSKDKGVKIDPKWLQYKFMSLDTKIEELIVEN